MWIKTGNQRKSIEIADAYTQLLSQSTAKQLIDIAEGYRRYPDYYGWDAQLWKPAWKDRDMSRSRFPHLSDVQYASVLKLGTFHADGYCREACMRELLSYEGTLPFFLLRMNDWVEKIREQAYILACRRLESCDIHELIYSMPMLDKLKNSRRRRSEYVSRLEELFAESIMSKAQTIELDKVHTYDATVKNSIYRFVNRTPVLSLDAMETLLHFARDSYGKRMLILGILHNYECGLARMEKYLGDKSSVVRYETLVYRYYTREKAPWDELSVLLIDKCRKIRLEAAYILEKHAVLHVLAYYRGQLAAKVSAAAIYGIGEHGGSDEITLVMPFLESGDERIARAALTAYLNLAGEGGRELYWKYLFDDRTGISRCAYLAIRKYDIHYGSETLYNEYLRQDGSPARRFYLLNLLCTEPSTWERLPYLLLLWGSGIVPGEQEHRVWRAICRRSMYAHVSPDKAMRIQDILDELSRTMPAREMAQLRKEIEYELRYVTR